jgi:hypothetical protein
MGISSAGEETWLFRLVRERIFSERALSRKNQVGGMAGFANEVGLVEASDFAAGGWHTVDLWKAPMYQQPTGESDSVAVIGQADSLATTKNRLCFLGDSFLPLGGHRI